MEVPYDARLTLPQEDTIARVQTHLIAKVVIMCAVQMVPIVKVVFVVPILIMESYVVLDLEMETKGRRELMDYLCWFWLLR